MNKVQGQPCTPADKPSNSITAWAWLRLSQTGTLEFKAGFEQLTLIAVKMLASKAA
jgi:hypothetical protein